MSIVKYRTILREKKRKNDKLFWPTDVAFSLTAKEKRRKIGEKYH